MNPSSKQSSSVAMLCKPSELPVGTVARFVHARTGTALRGRVAETGPDYALVRPLDDNGLHLLQGMQPINDSKYIVKEVDS